MNRPKAPVLPREVRGTFLQNVDTQFACIIVAVAALQIGLLSYAQAIPGEEPLTVEDYARDQGWLQTPRHPPPLPVENTEPAPAEVRAEAPAPARRRGPIALERTVSDRGLLGVLGSKGRKPGAIGDVFEDGDVTRALAEAFAGARGVDVRRGGEERGTRAGDFEGVELGGLETGGTGPIAGHDKDETEVEGELDAETPSVDGELAPAEVARVMKRHLDALRACYEGLLKRDRALAGKLVLHFEIDPAGRTRNVSFEEDSLGAGEVNDCIARRAHFWRFPSPGGGSVFVAYPLVFAPAE